MARRTRRPTTRRPLARLHAVLAVLVATAGATTACGADGPAAPADRGDCPTDPVEVTLSVDQWADLVRTVGGDCVGLTTVVESTAVDPHEFEPTPADTARLTDADLVVVNGLGYDEWATKAADAAGVPVVDAARATGRTGGANPHVWYDPAAQDAVAEALSARLAELRPGAAGYLADRVARWADALAPYRAAVDAAAAGGRGRSYAATEPVAEYLADAVGLEDRTPEGFARAAANETEPSPGDVAALSAALEDGAVDVLVVNSQRAGSLNDRLVDAAEDAGVPVVEVTETVPAGADGFVDWQVAQATALRRALDGAGERR